MTQVKTASMSSVVNLSGNVKQFTFVTYSKPEVNSTKLTSSNDGITSKTVTLI